MPWKIRAESPPRIYKLKKLFFLLIGAALLLRFLDWLILEMEAKESYFPYGRPCKTEGREGLE